MNPGNDKQSPLIDSHCHLTDERLIKHTPAILQRARSANIQKVVSCATSPADWSTLKALSEGESMIVPAFGVHPWFLDKLTSNWFSELKNLLRKTPEALIGETGLDHLHNKNNRPMEEEVFILQLELSKEIKRPCVIHCIRAWDTLLQLLKQQAPFPAPLILHSYGGSAELVQQLCRYNIYFSFSGALTNPKNIRGHKAVRIVPGDRLLIETDAPDFLPYRLDALANEPSNLPYVLQAAAELRQETTYETAALTYNNIRHILTFAM